MRRRREGSIRSSLNFHLNLNNRNSIPYKVQGVQRKQKKKKAQACGIPLFLLFLLSCLLICVAAAAAVITLIRSHHDKRSQMNIFLQNSKRHQTVVSDQDESFISLSKQKQEQECQPIVEWQERSFPTCNTFHEMNLKGVDVNVAFVSKGFIRGIWRIGQEEDLVLKTLLYNGDFDRNDLVGQAMDATISDQLTVSDSIANIYGYCKFLLFFISVGLFFRYESINFYFDEHERWCIGTL